MKNKMIVTITILVCIGAVAFLINLLTKSVIARKHFAEKPLSPQILDSTEFSRMMESINMENMKSLKELESFQNEELGMVVALSEAPDRNILQAVYENGILVQYDLITQKIITSESLFARQFNPDVPLPVYKLNSGINFNRDGSLLIAPTNVVNNRLHGEVVWNTNRKSITLKTENYDFQALQLHPIQDTSFIVFEETDDVSYRLGVGSKFVGGGMLAVERYNVANLTRIALDPNGDYLAAVDINGSIIIGDVSTFSGQEGFFEYGTLYRLLGYAGKDIVTVDLEFDDTHSWLGWLTDEKLVVWSLRNYAFPLEFKTNIKDAKALAFDHTGKILAVATQNGIKIFDVEKGKQIIDYSVGDVTTLYFTRDNRLLVWGDANGNVHLWGVK